MNPNVYELDTAVPHTLCLDDAQALIDIFTRQDALTRTSTKGACMYDEERALNHRTAIDLDGVTRASDEDILDARIFPGMSPASGYTRLLQVDVAHARAATQRYLAYYLDEALRFTIGAYVTVGHATRRTITHVQQIVHGTLSAVDAFSAQILHHYAEQSERLRHDVVRANHAAHASTPAAHCVRVHHLSRELSLHITRRQPWHVRCRAVDATPILVTIQSRGVQHKQVTMRSVLQALGQQLLYGTYR